MGVNVDTDDYGEWECNALAAGCDIGVTRNYVSKISRKIRELGQVSIAKITRNGHLSVVGMFIHDVKPPNWTRKRGQLSIP